MKILLQSNKSATETFNPPLTVISAFNTKTEDGLDTLDNSHWPEIIKSSFAKTRSCENFKGKLNDKFLFPLANGNIILAIGLGARETYTYEILRGEIEDLFNSLLFGSISKLYEEMAVDVDYFNYGKDLKKTINAMAEGFYMAEYPYYNKKNSKTLPQLKTIVMTSSCSEQEILAAQEVLSYTNIITDTTKLNWEGDFVSDIRKFTQSQNNPIHTDDVTENKAEPKTKTDINGQI